MKNVKSILGKIIKCKQCQQKQARVVLEDGRYKVQCAYCNADYYLKEQHL